MLPLSDIVGCFCGFGEVEVVGAGFRKRDIRIFTDYSITSTVTLWGKLGERFDPALYTQDGGPYVMVISSVTVKTFQGSGFQPCPLKSIEGTASAKLPPEEAMFVNRMTIEDLVNATCDGKLKIDVVTLKATITAINNHNGWFYVSCKSCIKKAVPKDGVYVYTGCGEAVDYPLALFRVNVQVADDIGSTTVVLFNAVTERMLDVSAKKLINKMPPGDNSVPPELQPLLGKELVFKLKLNKYNSVDGPLLEHRAKS